MEDVPLNVRAQMWFMHDGAPPHINGNVTAHLNNTFSHNWIGRRDVPVEWPPRSPDLTPLVFFLWGALKNKVYANPVESQEELIRRVQNEVNVIRDDAEMLRKIQFNFIRRIQLCIREIGGHIERLL